MSARRPLPDPDTRRPAGADRPRAAPPTHVLVEGSGAGSRRHHPAHPQGRAVIDPAAHIMPAARGAALWKAEADGRINPPASASSRMLAARAGRRGIGATRRAIARARRIVAVVRWRGRKTG